MPDVQLFICFANAGYQNVPVHGKTEKMYLITICHYEHNVQELQGLEKIFNNAMVRHCQGLLFALV